MLEQLKLIMANQYFDRRMRKVFVDRVSRKGIETFEEYLAYRYRDNCYYYSGYAIMGLNNDDYLLRGSLVISDDFIWGKGGYSHGWVEFKYMGQEFVFDSMCKNIVYKADWYDKFKPKIQFKYSNQELIEKIMDNAKEIRRNCYEAQKVELANNDYTAQVFRNAKLYMHGNKVKKFIAYSEPSG